MAFTPKPSMVWKRRLPSTWMATPPVGVGVGVGVGPAPAAEAYIEVRCGQLPSGLKVAGRLVLVPPSVRSGLAAVESIRVTRSPPACESRAIQYGCPAVSAIGGMATLIQAPAGAPLRLPWARSVPGTPAASAYRPSAIAVAWLEGSR